MAMYFGRDFEAALALFEQVCATDPVDAVPRMFAERCARYVQAPSQEDWEVFERLVHK